MLCAQLPVTGQPGKAETRCQGRWRSGNQSGAKGDGGRGALHKGGNKVVGESRALEMKTT